MGYDFKEFTDLPMVRHIVVRIINALPKRATGVYTQV